MICGFSHLLARLCFVFVSIFLIIFFVLIVPVGLFRVDCFFVFLLCAPFLCAHRVLFVSIEIVMSV